MRNKKILIIILSLFALVGCVESGSKFVSDEIELEVNAHMPSGEEMNPDEYKYIIFKEQFADQIEMKVLNVDTSAEAFESNGKLDGSVSYFYKGKNRYTKFKYTLYDNTPPKIELVRPILRAGDEFTDLSLFKVTDNSTKEELSSDKIQIKGTVDVMTPGEYELKVFATDESGNKSSESFTIEVIDK